MIQPNELRIGNFIDYSSTYPFNGQFDIQFARYIFDVQDEWEFLHPIPLTEEWLLKFGFVDIPPSDKRVWRINIGSIFIDIVRDEEGKAANHSKYKYVHQLQNLYFALTGKELELKKETV